MRRWKPAWRRMRFLLLLGWLTPLTYLPRRAGLALMSGLGRLAGRLLPGPRRRILANAALVFPRQTEAEREAFADRVLRNVLRNAYDFLRLSRYRLEEIEALVRIEGLEHLERARQGRLGVVCLSAHLGCWELIPYRMRACGYQTGVVYRRLRDPSLDAYVAARRRRFGIGTYDRDTGARGMIRCLRSGGLLGVLIDQHTRVDSVRVPFLGRPAWTPTGAVRLALRTETPIVPVVIDMEADGRHRLRIGPAVPIERPGVGGDDEIETLIWRNTARCNEAIGRLIWEAREQWVWFHERWRDA
ncbi:MAG: hypothetical protein GF330_08415 [Candidatus Eisenbacteria bacterium]|nr:hypothetical protein [Candidatus Eisenbacteria bacterium]